MPLRSIPQDIRDNIQWELIDCNSHHRTYLSTQEETINGLTAQWLITSPFSYGVLLLSFFPNKQFISWMEKNKKLAFYIVDQQLFFISGHNSVNLVTNNKSIIEQLSMYLAISNIFPTDLNYTPLSISDLNTFKHITGFDISKYPEAAYSILHNPNRMATIWNKIQPDYPAFGYSDACLLPWIKGESLNEREMINAQLHYYKYHRILLFNPTDNIIVKIDGHYLCTDTTQLLKLDIESDMRYAEQLKSPTSYLSTLLATYYAQGYSYFVDNVMALLYLDQHIAFNDIKAEYICEEILQKLHALRELKIVLSLDLLILLSFITKYEKLDNDLINRHTISNLIFKLNEGIFVNEFMYLVVMKPRHVDAYLKPKYLYQLERAILTRNRQNQNALDLAIRFSPSTVGNILYAAIGFSVKDQQNLLSNINDGRYKNILAYAISKWPRLFNILCDRVPNNIEWQDLYLAISLSEHALKKFHIERLLEILQEEIDSSSNMEKTRELAHLYESLSKIKYHFIFSKKTTDEKNEYLKTHGKIAYTLAESNLILKYYGKNPYIPTFLMKPHPLTTMFYQFKQQIDALQAPEAQITSEDQQTVLIDLPRIA
ncbi:MAG: hypothetical protein Q8R83_07810 [Legionellaceae bacterium]|nr:hypothetical protein [Legionellaceae bacterium]